MSYSLRILSLTVVAQAFLFLAEPALGAVPGDAGSGNPVVLEREDADRFVRDVFGLDAGIKSESSDRFDYQVRGFLDSRKCPLHGLRGLNCVDLEWTPSVISVHRNAWEGPVSGHLSRNLVVMVDMSSSSVGFAIGTMHGVLVTPSGGISRKRPASFGWYLSRSGASMSVSLKDVSGDDSADVIYTYSQVFPRGVLVAVQDVWTFSNMEAVKYISSGEKLSGVLSSTFEGVPVFFRSDERVEFGRFIYPVAAGMRKTPLGQEPAVVVVERSISSGGAGRVWELQVVADAGSGWVDYLAVQGNPSDPSTSGTNQDTGRAADGIDAPEHNRCAMLDLSGEVPVAVRRLFLDIEEVCGVADGAASRGNVLIDAVDLVFRGISVGAGGFPVIASVLFESAAENLAVAGFRPMAAVLSWLAAAGAGVAVDSFCGGDRGRMDAGGGGDFMIVEAAGAVIGRLDRMARHGLRVVEKAETAENELRPTDRGMAGQD